MPDPKFPDVEVELIGQDGNAFNLIGLVARGLKRAGYYDAATEFSNRCFNAESYDEVLQLCMEYVEVI